MKKLLICCLSFVIVMSASIIAFGSNEDTAYSDANMLKEVQVSKSLLNQNNSEKVPIEIAEVKGEIVYNNEFILRYEKAIASGSSAPYEDTVKSMVKIKSDYAFAKEHNIVVTDEDVIEYTNEQREFYENQVDPELKAGIKSIIDTLGMTEDEYWSNYKLKENRDYLTYRNVEYYQEQNKIKPEEIKSNDFQLINKNFNKTDINKELNI